MTRELQKDNTRRFNGLPLDKQNKARKMGYKNSGKVNVQKTAKILDKLYTYNIY